MDAVRRERRSRSSPTARCRSVASCTWSHSGATGQRERVRSVGGCAVGQPFGGRIGPEVSGGGQNLGGRVEVELDESVASDLELEPVHGRAGHIAVAPHLEPPAGALGGHVGRFVVETSHEGVRLAAAELEIVPVRQPQDQHVPGPPVRQDGRHGGQGHRLVARGVGRSLRARHARAPPRVRNRAPGPGRVRPQHTRPGPGCHG